MFAKSYKLKSNNTLKNSEKKHLAQRIQNEFPTATEEQVKNVVPVKSNSSCMKLTLHSGDTVGVYVVDGVPVLVDIGEKLIPTVYALWKAADLVPTIYIHSQVLSKVQNGAPLYAPGVVTEPTGFPYFPRGAVIAACTSDNGAAAIVGRAVMSSGDLLATSMGVCLETYHVVGDLLCKDSKFTKVERPKLKPICLDASEKITADINQLQIKQAQEEWPSLVKEERVVANQPAIIPENNQELLQESTEQGDQGCDDAVPAVLPEQDGGIPSDMDGLLLWCLLSFLKREGKNLELPLKTNLLYKNHLMAYCPPDRTLDVKKSTYKKMGKFLEAMEKEGLIVVRELEKGVSALVALQAAHPLVRAHRAPPAPAPPAAHSAPAAPAAQPPAVRELYCVTAHVADLLAPLKKGTALSASEVRAVLQRYAAARQLSARGAVTLDELLARVAGRQPQEIMKWEELMSSVLGRMTPSTEMRYADGTAKLIKSRLDPVQMQVATRSGNKKVTLVSNLEAFGFELTSLARTSQLRVGAACGVTRCAGARCDQLMLQGDQTHFIAKLLIEEYGLPKKFLEGADKALNKKK